MKIYVGLWSLLPEDWEGINGLYEKTEQEIKEEVERQNALLVDSNDNYGDYVGEYDPFPFEEEFNHSNSGWFNSDDYFIKIF